MKGQPQAGAAVNSAIKHGKLPQLTNADGETTCIDCGQPATVYDHRDYSKPLDVDPVCRSCNSRRGRAAYLCGDYRQMQRNVYMFARVFHGPMAASRQHERAAA